MAGRVERPEGYLSHRNFIALVKGSVGVSGLCKLTDIDRSTCCLVHLKMPAHKIGVQVRLHNRYDSCPVLLCKVQVRLRVPGRIHKRYLLFAQHRVGGMGQALVIKSFNTHCCLSLVKALHFYGTPGTPRQVSSQVLQV